MPRRKEVKSLFNTCMDYVTRNIDDTWFNQFVEVSHYSSSLLDLRCIISSRFHSLRMYHCHYLLKSHTLDTDINLEQCVG